MKRFRTYSMYHRHQQRAPNKQWSNTCWRSMWIYRRFQTQISVTRSQLTAPAALLSYPLQRPLSKRPNFLIPHTGAMVYWQRTLIVNSLPVRPGLDVQSPRPCPTPAAPSPQQLQLRTHPACHGDPSAWVARGCLSVRLPATAPVQQYPLNEIYIYKKRDTGAGAAELADRSGEQTSGNRRAS